MWERLAHPLGVLIINREERISNTIGQWLSISQCPTGWKGLPVGQFIENYWILWDFGHYL